MERPSHPSLDPAQEARERQEYWNVIIMGNAMPKILPVLRSVYGSDFIDSHMDQLKTLPGQTMG